MVSCACTVEPRRRALTVSEEASTMSILTQLGRGAKLTLVPLALAALAACASPFNADVSRFESQLPGAGGPDLHRGGRRSGARRRAGVPQYAQQVADHMARARLQAGQRPGGGQPDRALRLWRRHRARARALDRPVRSVLGPVVRLPARTTAATTRAYYRPVGLRLERSVAVRGIDVSATRSTPAAST